MKEEIRILMEGIGIMLIILALAYGIVRYIEEQTPTIDCERICSKTNKSWVGVGCGACCDCELKAVAPCWEVMEKYGD